MTEFNALRAVVLTITLTLAIGCSAPETRLEEATSQAPEESRVWRPDDPRKPSSIGERVDAIAVDANVTLPPARYVINAEPERLAELSNPFPPTPKKQRARSRFVGPGESSDREARSGLRATRTTIESIDTQTNSDNTGGFLFIPADAHGAAGPNHVVAVTNVSIEIFQKDGTLQLSTSLKNFFNSLSPPTFTFDPKVIYDQYEDRWLVVTLERTDIGNGDASNTSSILLAVSDDSNPNGSWTMTRIDASVNIGGDDHWFDYPGFAVDEQAVHITGNMFQYFGGTSAPGTFGGVRLFIVDKGTAGGFYDGSTATVSLFDPVPPGAFDVTLQPAHTYGVVPGTVGTWLTGWSGLNAAGNSAYQVITVDSPLGTPTFTSDFVRFGNVDDLAGGFPPAPQAGMASNGGNIGVATNDRRTLNAVWRDDGLWVAHSFQANSGADSGQVTAAWARIDTATAVPSLDQFGFIGGEDIAPGAFTFFPSLAVNDDGGMLLGFSASASSIFAGTYYSYRTPTDPAATLRGSILIRPGLDYYQRTFGGADNRWGDYSSAALDPNGACFWAYNKYAIARGTSSGPGDDGRWGTAFVQFCNDAPVAAADAADVDNSGTVTVLDSGQASVLANDTDADASDTLVVTTTPVSGPDHAASFTLNADGTFSYTHDGSATLADTVVYELCDDGSPIECSTGSLQITIGVGNQPPDAVDDTATVAEGGTVTLLDGGIASVLANDSDPEGNTLQVNGSANPAPGNASAFSLQPNGTFSYTHDGSETGSDGFGYEVCDDGTPVRCANAAVTLTITEVNDPPIANDETLSDIAEDSGVRTIPFADLLANDDPGLGEGGQSLTITLVGDPVGGTVAINGTDVEFAPASNYSGPAGFDYRITDDGTTSGNPDPKSDIATASFTITPVNDPPMAVDDEYTTDFDQTLNGDVSLNDFDIDSANLTYSVDAPPSNGSLTLDPDGTFEYVPAAGFFGQVTFGYSVSDGELSDTATVTIDVIDVVFMDGFEDLP